MVFELTDLREDHVALCLQLGCLHRGRGGQAKSTATSADTHAYRSNSFFKKREKCDTSS